MAEFHVDSAPEFMAAVYAAATHIADGSIAEAEVEWHNRTVDDVEHEISVQVVMRKTLKPWPSARVDD